MYSDIVKINKNFQTSINLEFDLNNEAKIREYIPTSDICDVLKKYIKSIVFSNGNKATTLIGPYGKGKSFLLLVLAYLISQESTTEVYRTLCKKISKIDPELYELIERMNSSKIKLLPVIVNSNYNNLNQSFMLGLNDALKRADISNIIPETTYNVCLSLIDDWTKDTDHITKVMAKCENKLKTSLGKIEMGLKNYSVEAYKQFEQLYNCVTHGMPFNPLVNDDIVHVYAEVNHALIKQGFTGMFIVFDEFSKFLESSEDAVSKNLKIVQDMAELSNRSSQDNQLHLCCVTHKSLSLYKSKDKMDSFKTVEGRFKEIKFNRTLDENYQIISAAISNDKAKPVIDSFINDNQDFYNAVKSFEPFSRNINLKNLYYGCFPLNPITVYSLIQLSELVAQNERTLFTFISDTDEASLNSFIKNNDKGLFNVDKVYDYFSPLMKREESNDIRNIWYRTEATLSRIDDLASRKIIKSLAVALMINDFDNFPPNENILALSTMFPEKLVLAKIEKLINEHFLRKNMINNLLSFATSNSKEIEDQISMISQAKARSISFETVLDEINETKYLLPRRYNEQNKITRFYKVSFITEEQLCNLSSFDLYRERMFSDGIVLYLIRLEMSDSQICDRFLQYKDSRVILRYPSRPVTSLLREELIRYASLQELLKKGGNDDIITSEIELLVEETAENLKELILNQFETEGRFISYAVKEHRSFNELLSDQMDRIFTKRIIFNNELINKNKVTSVYQKAANNIIDDLINKKSREYSPTSPETTIKNSVVLKFVQPDVKEVIEEIKLMILKAENQKLRVNEIVEKYSAAPYGIRIGILPILIAFCISELSDNILLYLKNKEIDLNSNNLIKAVNTDSDYYFRCSKGTLAQTDYLKDLLYSFGKEPVGNFRIDTRMLCEEYRKFFVGLPMIMRNASSDNGLGMNKMIIEYKKAFMTFSLNPYEVVFEKPLKIYDSQSYDALMQDMKDFITNWRKYLDNFKGSIVSVLKDRFNIRSSTSLRMGLNSAVKEAVGNENPILSDLNSRIFATINNISFDDIEAINQLTNACLNSFVEDWMEDRTDDLCTCLDLFFDEVTKAKKINASSSSIEQIINEINETELSSMGSLFQNSVESVFDEFGESVSTEEKIAILSSMLKKYL